MQLFAMAVSPKTKERRAKHTGVSMINMRSICSSTRILCIALSLPFVMCGKTTIPERWHLTSRTNYNIDCVDEYDETKGVHYLGKGGLINAILNSYYYHNASPGKTTCLKYDTSFETESIDSSSARYEWIEFYKDSTFAQMFKMPPLRIPRTRIFLYGTYNTTNDTIVLNGKKIIDNCGTTTNFDSTTIIVFYCDSLHGMISADFMVNLRMKLIMKSNDSLILRKRCKFREPCEDFDMIDYVFIK